MRVWVDHFLRVCFLLTRPWADDTVPVSTTFSGFPFGGNCSGIPLRGWVRSVVWCAAHRTSADCPEMLSGMWGWSAMKRVTTSKWCASGPTDVCFASRACVGLVVAITDTRHSRDDSVRLPLL